MSHVQLEGFVLAHNRPILQSRTSEEALAKEQTWWRSCATWNNGIGYRRGTTAIDSPQFLVALAKVFTPSALAPANQGLSSTLQTDPVEGLVHATLEQVAWASFKVLIPSVECGMDM